MIHLQEHQEQNGLLWLSAPGLNEKTAVHGFSTRLGGVSHGSLASLNLGTGRGDDLENVRENFRRFGAAVGFNSTKTVFSKQVHRDNVRVVTAEDCGKGLYREREYEADGLITDIPGIPIVIFSADCIPILFHDPVRHVVAACHAGWRGTVLRIAAKTVRIMKTQYGCRVQDLHTVIGPGISRCCFETHADVPEALKSVLGSRTDAMIDALPEGKFLVDLKAANTQILQDAGIPIAQIECSDACTHCRQDLFWSHRRTGNARGVMAAVIQLI